MFSIMEQLWNIYLQYYSCIKKYYPEDGQIIGRNMLVKIL